MSPLSAHGRSASQRFHSPGQSVTIVIIVIYTVSCPVFVRINVELGIFQWEWLRGMQTHSMHNLGFEKAENQSF